MRPSKQYLHFIINTLGQSYYRDGYNNAGVPVIKTTTIPTFLTFSPRNWKDVEMAYGRDINKYHGINRSFTQSYEFLEDGKDVINYLAIKKGYEENAILIIQEHNHLNDTYETIYKGQIDFREVHNNENGGIEVNLIEGGLKEKYNSNDEKPYELPLDRDSQDVLMDGVELVQGAEFLVTNGALADDYADHILSLELITQESRNSINSNSTDRTVFANAADIYTTNDWFNVSEGDGNIEYTFEWNFGVLTQLQTGVPPNPAAGLALFIRAYDASNTATAYVLQTFSGPSNTFRHNTFSGSLTVSIPPVRRLYLLMTLTLGGVPTIGSGADAVVAWSYDNSTTDLFKVKYKFRRTSSIVKTLRPLTAFEKLHEKITDSTSYTATSQFLTNFRHLVITSGDGLRRLDNAVIKTNFTNFFKAYNAVLCASFSILGTTAYFERRRFVYDNTNVTLSAGESSNFEWEWAKELFFNLIKVGYPSEDVNDINGKLEFNTTSQFSAPTKSKKTLDLVSPYKAGPYSITYAWLNLEGKTTTDGDPDNNVYLLNIVDQTQLNGTYGVDWVGSTKTLTLIGQAASVALFPVGKVFKTVILGHPFDQLYFTVASTNVAGSDLEIVVTERVDSSLAFFTGAVSFPALLRRETYTQLLGDVPTSIFNIEDLTPMRMLLKHGYWIRSILYMLGLQKLIFLTSDKNKELSTTLSGVTITEKADIRIDTLDPAIFYPIIFSQRTLVPGNFLTVMNAAVNGHISFTVNGTTLYGYPLNMSVKPVFNEAQTWKLLASISNNIDDLLNLEPLLVNDATMSQYRLSFSHLCPLRKIPIGEIILPQYNSKHMDSFFWHEQITNYMQRKNYYQKWQTNDIIKLQLFTKALGPVQEDIFDCHGTLIDSISYQLIATAALQAPYQLYEANINLQNYAPGIYYTITTAGISAVQVQFISEGIDLQIVHPKTKLFSYSHSKNKLSTIFTGGYNPDFRIEADIRDFEPGLNFSTYEDEPADIDLIEAIPYRKFTLEIGKGQGNQPVGVPDYMIDKLNRIMGLSDTLIDGKAFTRNGTDAQFEAKRYTGTPAATWTLAIREKHNRQSVSLDDSGNLQKSAVVAYNIDTGKFGDFAGQVSSNVVQVERVENTQ